MSSIPAFDRNVGIDYSGAQTPTSSLKGLRVYVADRMSTPVEVAATERPQILDAARHSRMVSRAAFRRPPGACWNRSRVFFSAAIF